MWFLIEEYTPVFVISVFAGFCGIIKRREISWMKFVEISTSNGLLGTVTFVFLNSIYPNDDVESKYAIICLLSYTGVDSMLSFVLKMKGIKSNEHNNRKKNL